MAPQLGNVGLEATFGKKARDFRAQPASWGFICDHRIAQNVANFLLHAVAVPSGTPLQPGLDSIFDIADNELGHGFLPCAD